MATPPCTLYTFAGTGAATFRPLFGDLNQFDMQVGEGVNQNKYKVVVVDYPGAHMPWDASGDEVFTSGYTIQLGCEQGRDNAVTAITATEGKFAFAAYSLGCVVAAMVYAEIVSGSLTSRAGDFLGAVTFGNPVREAGHTIPGGTDPGGQGALGSPYLMTSVPASWWDFADTDPLDPVTTTGTDAAGVDFTEIVQATFTTTGVTEYNSIIGILEAALPDLTTQIPALWQIASELFFPWLSPTDNVDGHLNYNKPYGGLPNNTLTAVQLAVNYLNGVTAVVPSPPSGNYWPTIQKRYPAGPVTPAAAYHLMHDHMPLMNYRSYDNTTVFCVYGAMAIYDRSMPESVQVTDMKGLVPPWQNITQKGATQDGETYITSLYDPIEVDITVRIRGRDGHWIRKVQRDWIASWDAIQPGELSWFSHDMGRWWAPVRWSKAMADKLTGGNQLPQSFIMSAIAYDGFWRSYDDVDSFAFAFASGAGSDNFAETTTEGVTGWTITYSAVGGWLYETAVGDLSVFGIPVYTPGNSGMVQWANDPDNAIGLAGVDAVAVNNTFVSDTDNQVVSIQLGSMPSWFFFGSAYNDIWLRCPPPGTIAPGIDGVRLRVGNGLITLSYFIDSVETVLHTDFLVIPPLPGEIWTVVTSGRTFTVKRGNSSGQSTVFTVFEQGTGSLMGSGYRCAGFGMHVSLLTTPASVLNWSAGDNSATSQSGYLTRINMGDQPMWDRYTLYAGDTDGAVFTIGDGPNNPGNAVTYGPMTANQIVQIRTDPRKRGVTDLTSQPATPQALKLWQIALEDFLSFAIGNNTIPLAQAIESEFGTTPPQGNPYSLLNGRFSDNAAIPAKPVAGPVPTYEVPVSISGGNANSRIVAAGTPLRRFPY